MAAGLLLLETAELPAAGEMLLLLLLLLLLGVGVLEGAVPGEVKGDAPGEFEVEGEDDAGGLAAEGLGEVGVVEVEEEVGDDDGDVLEDAAYEQYVVTRQGLRM